MTPEEENELAMLRAFAARHGWQTADGAWVAGIDRIYYCTCKQTPTTPPEMRLPFEPLTLTSRADEIAIPEIQKAWFSTPELAEVHARREWAKP